MFLFTAPCTECFATGLGILDRYGHTLLGWMFVELMIVVFESAVVPLAEGNSHRQPGK